MLWKINHIFRWKHHGNTYILIYLCIICLEKKTRREFPCRAFEAGNFVLGLSASNGRMRRARWADSRISPWEFPVSLFGVLNQK